MAERINFKREGDDWLIFAGNGTCFGRIFKGDGSAKLTLEWITSLTLDAADLKEVMAKVDEAQGAPVNF